MASTRLTREQLEAQARALPVQERARLAEALLSSLEDDPEIERAWLEEIRRRAAELDAGTVTSIPAEQVFAELNDLLKG